MKNSVRGIVFDMDGVLLDSEPYILKAGQMMLKERYDLEVPDEDFTPFVGQGEDAYLGGPAQKHGVEIKLPDDKNYTYKMYLEAIHGELNALEGVHDFVTSMAANEVPMAIFSSADRMKVDGNLKEIGLDISGFKMVLTGSEVAKKKPHPDGYIRAVESLQLPANEVLVIEDAVSGIQAGKEAGCQCLGITSSMSSAELKKAGASWTAPHLGAVPADLMQLLIGEEL